MQKAENLLTILKTQKFVSPTAGVLSFEQSLSRVKEYMEKDTDARYRVIIGSDSQPRNGKRTITDYVSAIVVHKLGGGGIYFWTRTNGPKVLAVRQRIYTEALLSLQLANQVIDAFDTADMMHFDLEIHVDVGNVGQTREIITEVVGMIRGNGFTCKTKPEAYGASSVADRHT